MDPALLERYRVLMAAYANGQAGIIQELKEKLIGESSWVRPDAMLCLLVLFEEMILKAYRGKLYQPGKTQPMPLPIPQIAQDTSDFDNRVRNSYEAIVKSLRNRSSPEPASSHDVLLAINSTWAELSTQLSWA